MAAEIPSGSVIITPDDMWKTVQETRDIARDTQQEVSKIRLLIDPELKNIREDVRTLDDREAAHHNAHGLRITDLEKASWSSRWIPALITSLLCSVAAGVVLYIITRGLAA
ncbi:hypothetical protein GCM10022239_03260 [Leifsonia bigeumensis]|uniref:DUF3618 domain-containing protein n=1 Tax=Leifsonella bigeumensis TaxID=433643 RepID=A0ABP7F2Z1_9MICO